MTIEIKNRFKILSDDSVVYQKVISLLEGIALD